MPIANVKEAKLFAAFAISGHDEPDMASEMLASLEAEREDDDEIDDVDDMVEDYAPVQEWLELDPLQYGNYEFGIDRLMFQLIEKRAAAFALVTTLTKIDDATKNNFLVHWMGNADGVFSSMDVLNSTQTKDMSLRNLWNTVLPFMLVGAPSSMEELLFIAAKLQSGCGYPSAEEKRALCSPYPHLTGANHSGMWDALDTHIRIWVRIWGIIGLWSEAPSDYTMEHAPLTQLVGIVDSEDLRALRAKYNEYVDRANKWEEIPLLKTEPLAT